MALVLNIKFFVNRITTTTPVADFIRVVAKESRFNETATLDVTFNEIPNDTVSAANAYIESIKRALTIVIEARQTIKAETKRDSIMNRVATRMNETFQGSLDQAIVDALRVRVY